MVTKFIKFINEDREVSANNTAGNIGDASPSGGQAFHTSFGGKTGGSTYGIQFTPRGQEKDDDKKFYKYKRKKKKIFRKNEVDNEIVKKEEEKEEEVDNIKEYYSSKKVHKNSFAYHLIKERTKLKNMFGENWDKSVTEDFLKEIILHILKRKELKISNRERNWWKTKMITDKGKIKILKIFYDAELSAIGLSVNKTNKRYKNSIKY